MSLISYTRRQKAGHLSASIYKYVYTRMELRADIPPDTEARIGAARPAISAIAPGAGESGISRRRTGAAPRRASPVSDNAVCASRIAFRDAQTAIDTESLTVPAERDKNPMRSGGKRQLFENVEQLPLPHPEAV